MKGFDLSLGPRATGLAEERNAIIAVAGRATQSPTQQLRIMLEGKTQIENVSAATSWRKGLGGTEGKPWVDRGQALL